nr:hypothetical protein CTI12_AA356920 [Tanacetum cinerariifolium]
MKALITNEARVEHDFLKTDSLSVSQGTTSKAIVQPDLTNLPKRLQKDRVYLIDETPGRAAVFCFRVSFFCSRNPTSRQFLLSLARVLESRLDWRMLLLSRQVVEEDASLTKNGVIMVKEKQNLQGRNQATSVAGSNTPPDTGLKSDEQNTNSKKLKQKPPVKKGPLSPTAVRGVEGGFMHTKTPSSGEFDSIVGMSIILVTLLIMVLWGKLCAILCTSAWFFVAPRLGGPEGHSAIAMAEKRRLESSDDVDLESVEYKKKVVMEGLLKRNHRNIVGRSTRS